MADIEKIEQALRTHVEKHKDRERAMFTVAGVRALLDELSRRQELIDRARSLVPRVYANWHADAGALSEREGQE